MWREFHWWWCGQTTSIAHVNLIIYFPLKSTSPKSSFTENSKTQCFLSIQPYFKMGVNPLHFSSNCLPQVIQYNQAWSLHGPVSSHGPTIDLCPSEVALLQGCHVRPSVSQRLRGRKGFQWFTGMSLLIGRWHSKLSGSLPPSLLLIRSLLALQLLVDAPSCQYPWYSYLCLRDEFLKPTCP